MDEQKPHTLVRGLETQKYGNFAGFALKKQHLQTVNWCLHTCSALAAHLPPPLSPLPEASSTFFMFQKRLIEFIFFHGSSRFPLVQKRMSSSPRYVNGVCNTPPLFPHSFLMAFRGSCVSPEHAAILRIQGVVTYHSHQHIQNHAPGLTTASAGRETLFLLWFSLYPNLGKNPKNTNNFRSVDVL